MSAEEIGCCGAYCRTCRAFRDGSCRGCRLGYSDGTRDLTRAKCRIKVCSMRDHDHQTCADCGEFDYCETLQTWYESAGGSRRRYRRSADFIRRHGYDRFIKIADGWKDAAGKL